MLNKISIALFVSFICCLTAPIFAAAGRTAPSNNHTLLSNASLSGFVIDMQTGEPLANVMIQCMDILLENASMSTTDTNGRFTVEGLSPGIFKVVAMPDMSSGYAWSMPGLSNSIVVPEGVDIENRYVAIQKGAIVTGRFVEADGITAISLADYEYMTPTSTGWGQTGVNGEFSIRLPVGDYGIALEVGADEYSNHFTTVSIPDLTTPVSLGDIILYSETGGEQIEGVFHNPASIPFVSNAYALALNKDITITPDNADSYWQTSACEILETGNYTINSLPPGYYDIYLVDYNISQEGVESAAVKYVVRNIATQDTGADLWYESEGGAVTGSITNSNGDPVIGAKVLFSNFRSKQFAGFAHTGADGNFTVRNMELGTYILNAAHRMYLPAEKIVTVPDSGITDTGNITFDFAGIQQGGDLNGDGLVDMFDLSMFTQKWFDSGHADLDADGIVNLSDFKVIGQMWMSQAAWRNN